MEENKHIEGSEKLKEVNEKLQNQIVKMDQLIEKAIEINEINLEKIIKVQKENENKLLEIERKINEIKSENFIFFQRLNKIKHFLNRLSDSLQNNTRNNEEILNKLEEVEFNEQFINKEEIICANFLENLSIGDKICYLSCIHFFHSSCIKNWIRRKNICPICNNIIII